MDDEVAALRQALQERLQALPRFLPRDLRVKRESLEEVGRKRLKQLEQAAALQAKLKAQLKALQAGVAAQEQQLQGLNQQYAHFHAPRPHHSLRRSGPVSNVHINLQVIPDPRLWDSTWVERLSSLTTPDLVLLHGQHLQRAVEAMSMLQGPALQAQLKVYYAHFLKVNNALRDLLPAAWSQRGQYNLETLEPMDSQGRPTPRQLYEAFEQYSTKEERACLLVLYRDYKAKAAQLRAEQQLLTERNSQAVARSTEEYQRPPPQHPTAGTRLQAAAMHLQAAGTQLQAAGPQLQAAGSQLQAAGTQLRAASFQLQDAGPSAGHQQQRSAAPGASGWLQGGLQIPHRQHMHEGSALQGSVHGPSLLSAQTSGTFGALRAATLPAQQQSLPQQSWSACTRHAQSATAAEAHKGSKPIDGSLELYDTTALLARNLQRQHDLGKQLWASLAMVGSPENLLPGSVRFAPAVVTMLDFALTVLPMLDAAETSQQAHSVTVEVIP